LLLLGGATVRFSLYSYEVCIDATDVCETIKYSDAASGDLKDDCGIPGGFIITLQLLGILGCVLALTKVRLIAPALRCCLSL